MPALSPGRFLSANPRLLEIASRLQIEASLVPHGPGRWLEKPNEVRARAVARAYAELTHDPAHRQVADSYDALRAGVSRQFEALTEADYTFRPWLWDGQPYANSADMRADVIENKSLAFFLGGEFPPDHPLAAYSGVSIGGHRLSFNDQLRCVHDVFGHALYGNSFSARGELLAARVHLEMFDPISRAALFSETAAQTCWFYFGPYTDIPASIRPFPSQKAAIVPARFRVL